MSSSIVFGEHLTIDGYGGSYDLLNSKKLVISCLQELPRIIGMQPISPVCVHWATPNGKKDPGGWSGYILIAESHVSAHTFPHRGFLSADVYTCRSGLDRGFIVKYFTDKFELDATEVNFILRGTRYPNRDIYNPDHGARPPGNQSHITGHFK